MDRPDAHRHLLLILVKQQRSQPRPLYPWMLFQNSVMVMRWMTRCACEPQLVLIRVEQQRFQHHHLRLWTPLQNGVWSERIYC